MKWMEWITYEIQKRNGTHLKKAENIKLKKNGLVLFIWTETNG